ncbi:MAG: potassium channel family protein [Planctomycetota bacterium]|jgi:hypothetical protein
MAEERHRTFGLLGTLLIIFVVLPLMRSGGLASLVGAVLFSAVILWGLWAVSEHRRQLIVAIVLMAPAFVFTILHHIPPPGRGIEIMWMILNGLALGFLIAMLLRRLFRTERVTADTLSSAISGYFLLGILWSFVYALLLQLDPGAFRAVEGGRASDLFYFSFVTLTTLGYGDITPASETAQTAAVLEAVVGQLYLAITIARLVGLHIAAAQSK